MNTEAIGPRAVSESTGVSMDTLRHYFIEHHLRAEFLISVALIAVARHVIQIDIPSAPYTIELHLGAGIE